MTQEKFNQRMHFRAQVVMRIGPTFLTTHVDKRFVVDRVFVLLT